MCVIVSFVVCCCIVRIYVTTVAVLLICVLSLYFAGCIAPTLLGFSCGCAASGVCVLVVALVWLLGSFMIAALEWRCVVEAKIFCVVVVVVLVPLCGVVVISCLRLSCGLAVV